MDGAFLIHVIKLLSDSLLVVRRLDDQAIDDAMRFVDMLQGAMLQAVGKPVIFSFGNVMVRFVE